MKLNLNPQPMKTKPAWMPTALARVAGFSALLLVLLGSNFNAQAATDIWASGSSGSWLTTGNWSLGNYPQSGDYAQFIGGTGTTVGIAMSNFSSGLYSFQGIEVTSARSSALTINNSSSTTAGVVTLTGTTINSVPNVILRSGTTKNFTFADGSSQTLGLALGNATGNIINLDSSGNITISDIISSSSGTTPLIFSGAGSGTITISGTANTFTGTIKIGNGAANAPEVPFAAPGSLGNPANAVVVDGGRLTLSASADISTHAISLGATAGTSISAPSGGVLTYTGVLADKDGATHGILVKQGTGTLLLGGVSTFSGNVSLNNGTIQLTNGDNRLPTGTTFNIGSSGKFCVFDLNGQNQQFAGLYSLAATSSTIESTTAATLTIAGDGSFGVGSGLPGIISGAVNVTMNGGGHTLALGGANTYAGNTTISAGTLALTNSGSIVNSPNITIAGGATFDVSGLTTALALGNSQTLTANGNGSSGTIATTTSKGLTLGTMEPLQFTAYDGTTPPLTITGAGSVTLAAGDNVTVTVPGAALTTTGGDGSGNYKLISKGSSGGVLGTAPSSVTVNGAGGLAAGTTASLVISGGELFLKVQPATSPAITVNPGSASFGSVLTNTTSASLSYLVAGANLTDPNGITINAPANFKISTDNSTFASQVMLPQSGGTVASTTVYVQFSPTAVAGYSGTSIANTSSGATEQDVAVSGFGAAVPAVTTQGATSIATNGATFNGTVTSSNNATITDRGFYYNTTGNVTLSDTKVSEGGTMQSAFSKMVAGLNPNQIYYYRAYAVNSIGTILDSSADETNFYTLANTPTAPTVNGATTGSLNVAIGGGDGNPAATTYAIKETNSDLYVQSSGTALGASPVYHTAAGWGTVTVTGLSPGTIYTFQVTATNGAGIQTPFSPTTTASTLALTFTAGDLAVILAADTNANNTTFSIVELNSSTAGQSSPVQTIAINGISGGGALRVSGSATTAPYLADGDDGTLLAFAGANSTDTSTAVNLIAARGVGTLDAFGNFTLKTTYTGVTTGGTQPRGATTVNDSTWFIGDQGGIYSNGSTTPSPAGNFRAVKSFGGTVYVLQTSSGTTNVNILSAAVGGTATGLPGLSRDSNASDFYLISSGNNGATYDVLYTVGTDAIKKFSLAGGTWMANGNYTATNGFGLCAAKSGSGAVLYVTTGTGATGGNSVIKLTDTAGYNSTISINTPDNVTLYTAVSPTGMKGIAFAPLKPASSTALASSLNPSPMGSNVMFVATVSGSFGTPTGTVQFKTNGVALGGAVTLAADGKVTNSTALLPAGTTTVAAEYSGDANYQPSTNTLAQVIIPPPMANPVTYYRAAGTSLKMSVTNLLAANTGDSAGDPVGLLSVAGETLANNMVIATTTNGSSVYYTSSYDGSAYLILTPTNNLSESFQYVVNDTVYPSLTATNLITITVTNAVGVSGKISTIGMGGSSVTTTWAGVVGDNYVVQRATILSPTPNWTDIWTTNSVPGIFSYTDSFSDLGGIPPAQAYYRLRSN